MSKIQSVRGTKDYFFEDQAKFSQIVAKAKQVSERFGYNETAIPIFEFTEVFKRSLGDLSEIVNKEMYTFEDRKGQSLTLRPEFTAGVMRAIISNGLYNKLPLKLLSWGPLFRYERPQRGRMRQFHQINCEYVGSSSPFADSEVISLANMILEELGFGGKFSLEINTLGDKESRKKYYEILSEYYNKYRNDLSEYSKLRLENNPLRILDSKEAEDIKINQTAPSMLDYLTTESKKHFDRVLSQLERMQIRYNINKNIVRGLDYYSHTTFEFITKELGSQGALIAGGRYDGLMAMMGGKDCPGVGFAGGIERMVELYSYQRKEERLVSVIALNEDFYDKAYEIAHHLRKTSVNVEVEHSTNLSKALKKALERNAKYAIFIGEEEINSGKLKIKNLHSRNETKLNLEELINIVKNDEF